MNDCLTVPAERSFAIPGDPGKVVFVIVNHDQDPVHIVRSVFEIKRAVIGEPHSLPREGWGYATASAIAPKTVLPARSELWLSLEAAQRTTFRGVISEHPPPATEPQCYLCGRLWYRRRYATAAVETAFYRRVGGDLAFSQIDPDDRHLNYAGRTVSSFF